MKNFKWNFISHPNNFYNHESVLSHTPSHDALMAQVWDAEEAIIMGNYIVYLYTL